MSLDEIAKYEGVSKKKILDAKKRGSLILCKNDVRNIMPLAIGEGVTTKVNANIGVSPDDFNPKNELKKAKVAVEAGADAVMDLSIGENTDKMRRLILKHTKVAVGTVPIYQVYPGRGVDFTLEDYLKEIEKQAKDGVDFMTIHAGLTNKVLDDARKRLIPITSRGGCFLAAWMTKNNLENPLYTGYDEILAVLAENNVTISLGDACRPGCLKDASDKAQFGELEVLGELTKRAWAAGVQVVVEGPGHLPLDHIEHNMKLQKKLCHNAPFYVLGPLVTDCGAGYDHITSAIGGAIAGMYGADFLCYVTPTEHLGLPEADDVYEGVMASRIAAHAADIVKLGRRERDDKMSEARRKLDWDGMYKYALDPNLARKHKKPKKGKECTMCGEYCALKIF